MLTLVLTFASKCDVNFLLSVYSIHELEQLMSKAVEMIIKRNCLAFQCHSFYRNKHPDYFEKIHYFQNGIMDMHVKDHHGDQANPINGQLPGIFFGVSVDRKTGFPPLTSKFGTIRLSIQAEIFLNSNTNLYFSDFYCVNKAHYVLLVITKIYSNADMFCNQHLVRLDKYNNPFLWIERGPIPRVMVTSGIWLEVFWTENVDIKSLLHNRFAVLSNNCVLRSAPHYLFGQPKNIFCTVCNIQIK